MTTPPSAPNPGSAASEPANRDFVPPDEPFALFAEWFALAAAHEANDPNAMALATATPDGVPSVRMVLLKGVDDAGGDDAEAALRGFVFYTNLESRKGGELARNPRAALSLYWKSLRRQVRVEGPVTPVDPAEADAYFASRARGSRIGAWASTQSRPLADRPELETAVDEATRRFGPAETDGPVPRPPHWSGFRLVPWRIEFWQERPYRLHDRVVYEPGMNGWRHHRLYP
jgi:pyridoxamine 5'-phosphate oxidase